MRRKFFPRYNNMNKNNNKRCFGKRKPANIASVNEKKKEIDKSSSILFFCSFDCLLLFTFRLLSTTTGTTLLTTSRFLLKLKIYFRDKNKIKYSRLLVHRHVYHHHRDDVHLDHRHDDDDVRDLNKID